MGNVIIDLLIPLLSPKRSTHSFKRIYILFLSNLLEPDVKCGIGAEFGSHNGYACTVYLYVGVL
jgi:hypothetical protein